MEIYTDGSLTLLAICVALAAYVSNVRRDIAKSISALNNDINLKLPLLQKSNQITKQEYDDLITKKDDKISKRQRDIVRLTLCGDLWLVSASICIILYWLVPYLQSINWLVPYLHSMNSQNFLSWAIFLFGIAVVALAILHFIEWYRTFSVRNGKNV